MPARTQLQPIGRALHALLQPLTLGHVVEYTIIVEIDPCTNVIWCIGAGLYFEEVILTCRQDGTLTPASVTFTSANWNSAQIVTANGQDDVLADADKAYSIITAAATSTDGQYNGLNPSDVSVTNTDNEVAGLTVVEIGGNTVTSESGTTQNFTIALDFEPESNVVVTITNPRTDEVSLDFTTRFMMTEELKDLPFSAIWAEYCERMDVKYGKSLFRELDNYQSKVSTRG